MALLCLIATPALSVTYTDNGDGTVTDPTTGLTWMRCAMGQTWTGTTCTGTPRGYTWDQANALTGTVTFAGSSDWRVPNIRELKTIADRSAYSPFAVPPALGPSINSTAFPNTPNGWESFFWSSSTWANPQADQTYVWGFSFGLRGHELGGGLRSGVWAVRLVRGGNSFALLRLERPTSDYVDHGNGTVTHTPTGLMWKRCAEGQVWTGTTCTGSTSTFTKDEARVFTATFAGNNDWRTPRLDELQTLVDYTRFAPAINTTVFPNTASTFWFWSSSSALDIVGGAWGVYIAYGTDFASGSSDRNAIRLVRVGQSSGPLTLSALAVSCPSSLTEGTSGSCTATATYSNGSSSLVTSAASWSSSNTSVATISAGTVTAGLVTANASVAINASYTENGATVTSSTSVVITDTPPSAITASTSTSATTGTAPLTVNFTGTGASTAGNVFTYNWNFGDGTASTERSPTHVYTTAGTYSVTLTVSNATGQSAISTARTITVTAQPTNVVTTVQSDCLFNWAERTYPTLFAPTASSNTVAQLYYRYYSQTRAYLATYSADNHLYYLGPLSGNAVLDAGAMSSWLAAAGCQ